MIFSTLLGFYKERRRAKKAIVEFEKFVEKLRDQQTKEESAEAKGEDEEVNPPASGDDDDEDKNKTKSWKKRVTDFGKNCKTRLASVGRRVKQAAKWLWERRKIKNKRLLELFFLVTLFLAMQAIGSLFYFAIALKFPMNTQKTGTVVGVAVQAVMFAILVSRHLRAIFFVTLPSLVGSRLRTILIIMMLIWAFQFPAQNVTTNIQSAMEGVNCVSQRVKAVAEEVKDRAGHAFRDAPMEQMREFLKDQAKPFEGIRKTMRKLDDSLEKMVAWQRELIGKIKNMMNNCSSLAQLPLKACVGWLGERHVDCLERFFEAICKPIDLAKHLCYLTKVFELNCDWPARLKGSIKEGVGNFVKGAKRRVGDYARETFVYDMYNKTVKHGVVAFKTLEIVIKHEQNYTEELDFDKERIHNELRKEIEGFGHFMNMIIFVLDVLMVLLTIWPFVMSVLYVRKFKKSESADNHYIDSHFEAIDQARAVNGQLTLLPLLPKEKMKYIRTCSLRTTRKEWIFMCVAHMFLLFSVLPIGVFILVDIFVYKLIRRAFIFFHGDSTVFPVPSIYKLKVSGNGYLNQLLGNILHTFEPLTDAKERDQLWRQCFVQPRPPNYDIFQVILAMYCVCALLIKVQIYVKRTKHLIALHYFPDRARPRALHLYDQILGHRMQLWDMMVDVQKSKDIDVTDNDRKLLLKGLGVLSADKQRCLRCARTDLSLQETQNVRLCVRCHSVYCVDCFAARQRCVKKECRASLQAITAEVELYIDSSCAEDDDSDMDIGDDDDDDEQGEEEEEGVVDEMEAMDEKLVETGVEVKEKAEEEKEEKMVENANKEVPEEQPKPMGEEEEAVEPKPNP